MNINTQQATLTFLLSSAYRYLFSAPPLVIEHSFADGLFCHHHDWTPIPHTHISQIKHQISEWIANDSPIKLTEKSQEWVLKEFKSSGLSNKPAIVNQWNIDPVPLVQFQEFWDYQIEPMELHKYQLKYFDLIPYQNGMLLRFPTISSPHSIPKFEDKPKLFSIFEENEQWGKILDIESIPKLNEHIEYNGIKDLIWVAEGLHEKKLSQIADSVSKLFNKKQVISIAGPSSSGKTTFSKRLSIHLKVNGISTLQISMDDYFVDRNKIPLNKNGEQNFESFDVLDSELLTKRIHALLEGKSIPKRKYDFDSGMGVDCQDTISLGNKQCIIIEGIHGLNPRLTKMIASGNVQKIYVSAITQLNIDGDHRFSTSDNRLMRRMVRDHRFRGYSPEETISRWKSVRMGEEKNIFPFQEEADFMFNSALIYELPVLAQYCTFLLSNISSDFECFSEAKRLSTLTSFFKPLEEEKVPGISILREFIGGSDFDY